MGAMTMSDRLPLPLAVGVLGDPHLTDRARLREARLDLALLAHELGYFLLDIVDVTAGPGDEAYEQVVWLAERTDAEAFVIHGEIDRARVEAVAERRRMVIRER